MTTDTQGVTSSAPSVADAAYATSGGHSTGFGLNAAISGILALSDALQGLTAAVADWATGLSDFVSQYSQENSEQAKKNADAQAAIEPVSEKNSDDTNNELQKEQTNQQSKTQADNTVGQSVVTMAQRLADLVENSTSQLSSGNAMMISSIGAIVNGYPKVF